jgi:hypothetical protein
MDIRLNIELRCARRQNDAAYQHYRRRSVTGGHAIILQGRHMEHQRSRGMFFRFGVAGQPSSHGPIVLRSPVRERSARAEEFYGQRDVMRMPEPEEFRQLRPRRATPPPKFGLSESKFGPKGF